MRISDWSSDVCSSDLNEALKGLTLYVTAQNSLGFGIQNDSLVAWKVKDGHFNPLKTQYLDHQGPVRLKATVKTASEVSLHRSEARRVGKACAGTCRSRRSANN